MICSGAKEKGCWRICRRAKQHKCDRPGSQKKPCPETGYCMFGKVEVKCVKRLPKR